MVRIKEISPDSFTDFAATHPLSNFHQSINYALVMAENGYEYDCIAYVDSDNSIVAASLILHKKIGILGEYGYCPRGFLIDYTNRSLLKNFTYDLKKYYYRKGFIFIKINPEIAIGEVNKDYKIDYNQNTDIIKSLEYLGFKPLKRNLYFESILPKFNAILTLGDYSLKKVSKHTRNKINKGMRRGLQLEVGNRDSIDILYNFIKNKKEKSLLYYKDYYNVFHKKDLIDVLLVKINSAEYLLQSKKNYEKELDRNSTLAEKLVENSNQKILNLKMQSDINLATYKEEMIDATKNYGNRKEDIYIAGAIVIKHNNRVNIYISGYDKSFEKFVPNYFLHHSIFEYYKKEFKYADLNGMSGDFSKDSPYYGLNKFKEGFHPHIYEFIGEFDLIIEKRSYNALINNGALAKEFNK